MRAEAWGVDTGWCGVGGEWNDAPASTVDAILGAMGPGGDAPVDPAAVRVVRAGDGFVADDGCELHVEGGGSVRLDEGAGLPSELDPGYHRLVRLDDGRETSLVLAPRRCFLPPDLHTWGWAVQLYGLRSQDSWGIGDLGDLRRLARWSRAELGAGMLLVNPLQAAKPSVPQEASPYYPGTRRFLNPLYLRLEEVPGWDGADAELAALAEKARAANTGRLIQRDPIYEAKLAALERLWERFGGDARFDAWLDEQGEPLLAWATYCVLIEDEVDPLPRPDGPEVVRVRREGYGRIRFHSWVQWLLDRQLAAASAEIDMMQDLPVGFDPGGADAWQWQDVLAQGVRVGAPPDEFNTGGQDWGLPPFDPWRLRAAAYQPFIETIRAGFRHGGGLRVDHVMGLFRLYWIPPGADATEGTYVRYPYRDLLGILALESQRASAYVCGEDLGTVEDVVREQLAEHDVLSYRLLWFEPDPPEKFPERAMAAVTTHDLPTIAGMWSGSDLEEQRELELEPNEESTAAIRSCLMERLGLEDDAPADEVVAGAYGMLGRAPSAILSATLDDVLAVEERPNQPGTTSELRPNWSIALPSTLEEIEQDPRARRIADALRR